MFVIAVAVLAITALARLQPDFVLLAVAVVGLSVLVFCNWRAGLAVALLGLFAAGNLLLREDNQQRAELAFPRMSVMEVEGRLTEDARAFERGWSAVARLRGEGLSGSKVNWLGTGAPPVAGTEMRAIGYFRPLQKQRNPGMPDHSERLRSKGVVATFKASEMRSEQWTGSFSKKAAAFKDGFGKRVIAGIEEDSTAAKVIHAVVLGEKARDSLELIQRFRESGTLHVFTVSGLHVAMLGSLVWLALKWAGVPRRWAIPVIIAAMFGYAWLAGNGPAAIRAAWMGTVFLGAFALRRQTDLLNSLGAVLLVALLIDPRMILMPGVQLSYGVVAAIGLATPYTRRLFAWIAAEEDFLPLSEMDFWQRKWLGFRRGLADGLGVSTAAWIGSAPLTMVHFGLITPVSVFATVALVLQVYILLAVALISALISPLWEGGSILLNRGNAVVAGWCAETAGFFAAIPGASSRTRMPATDTLVIYDLKYGAGAACFAPKRGKGVLLDSGGRYDLKYEVGPSLQRLGMIPDSVVFTHSDAGHVVPPDLLTEMFPIRQVAMGMPPSSGSVAAQWEDFHKENMQITQPEEGNRLDFGAGVWAEILLSPHTQVVGSLADDRCLVFRIHWRGWKILWLSDAGRLTEEALLDSDISLKSDLIVAGMHESDLSLTPDFIAAVAPQALVIGRSVGSEMDSIRKHQAARWKKDGITVFSQTQTGGITLTVGPEDELIVEGFLDESRKILTR